MHCAEVSSYLEVARRGGLALTGPQADRYLAEQRRSAAYVGLHPEDVPGSRAEMAAYFKAARPALRVTEEARAAVRFLLWPKMPPRLRLGTDSRLVFRAKRLLPEALFDRLMIFATGRGVN